MSEQTLKAKLKPLIKECLNELLIENGILSGVIAEVLKGVKAAGLIVENQSTPQTRFETQVSSIRENLSRPKADDTHQKMAEKMEAERQERIRRLNENTTKSLGIKGKNLNVFEGTTPPPPSVQELMESRVGMPDKSTRSVASNPLRDTDPNDPGVSEAAIAALFAMK